jgi:penicillin-binding protein 1A
MKTYDPVLKQETVWAPTNANGYFTGANMTLKSAFAQSINSIAVKLGQELGIDRIASTARKMGIESTLDETPSLALGASDVSLLELVNAYSTVANDGRVHKPILITRILDRDGKEIYTAPTEQQQAISYRSAFFMQQMLMGGLREPGGTSMNLWTFIHQFPDTDFGGKTGTSNNHSDAWFVGVSPQLVCGAWVGGEYRAIHFRTGQLGQGSRTALPVCGQFFQSVLGDPLFAHYRGKFPPLRDNTILSSMYQGTGYYYLPTDTIDEDDDEKLLYDELPDADAAPQQDAPANIPEGEPQQTAI